MTDTGITFKYLQVTQSTVTRTSHWKGYKPEVSSHENEPENEHENEPENEPEIEPEIEPENEPENEPDTLVDMEDIFSTSSVDVAEDDNQNAKIDLANYFSGINKQHKRPKCTNHHLFVNKEFTAW